MVTVLIVLNSQEEPVTVITVAQVLEPALVLVQTNVVVCFRSIRTAPKAEPKLWVTSREWRTMRRERMILIGSGFRPAAHPVDGVSGPSCTQKKERKRGYSK